MMYRKPLNSLSCLTCLKIFICGKWFRILIGSLKLFCILQCYLTKQYTCVCNNPTISLFIQISRWVQAPNPEGRIFIIICGPLRVVVFSDHLLWSTFQFNLLHMLQISIWASEGIFHLLTANIEGVYYKQQAVRRPAIGIAI